MIVRAQSLSYPKHISEDVDLLAMALGSAAHLYLFLDYGGTLVPGAAERGTSPGLDVLDMLEQLCEVESCSVFIVSGRTVRELQSAMDHIPNLGFVGQGGFEIRRPDGPTVHPVDPGTADTLLHHLELEAHRCLGPCPQIEIENRGFAITLHLNCDDRAAERSATQYFVGLVRELDVNRQLEVLYGDGVVEARVAGWHKGDAITHIRADADPNETLAIYIGDDVTDEYAFEALSLWSGDGEEDKPWFVPESDEEDDEVIPRALPILVAPEPRPTTASLFVRGTGEVHEVLGARVAIATTLL